MSASRILAGASTAGGSGVERRGESRRPPVLAGAFFVLVAAYGSWVPFDYQRVEWSTAWNLFAEILQRPLRVVSRSDWATNIALFVPIGFFGLGALVGPAASRWQALLALPVVCVLCLALSLAIEFGQLFLVSRICSQDDVAAETLGGIAGAALWVATGPRIMHWLAHRFTSAVGVRGKFVRLLEIYLLFVWVSLLLPLDLTIRPADLAHKYRAGGIQPLPLADFDLSSEGLLAHAWDLLLYVPLGMLLSIRGLPVGRRRSFAATLALGSVIVALAELCQVFVWSRYSSATDVILGSIGVLFGAWLVRAPIIWRRFDENRPKLPTDRSLVAALALAAVGYGSFAAAFLCVPFDLVSGTQEAAERAASFVSHMPLAALHAGSIDNAIANSLGKLLLFLPLGCLFALVSIAACRGAPRVRSRALIVAWLAVAMWGLAIEVVQISLPPHVPDWGDVLLATMGGALGVLGVEWVLRDRIPKLSPP